MAAVLVKVLRGVLALVLGVVAAVAATMVTELAGHMVFPTPHGLNHHDPASLGSIPIGALVFILVAWAVGTFAGAWVAARVAPGGKLVFGLAIGALFLLAGVAMMLSIPHPLWMWVIGVAEVLPAAYLGARLAAPRRVPGF
jgi:hypothetical protein